MFDLVMGFRKEHTGNSELYILKKETPLKSNYLCVVNEKTQTEESKL